MNINDLIAIVKTKLKDKIVIEKIDIEDKSFLHKNHVNLKRVLALYCIIFKPTISLLN